MLRHKGLARVIWEDKRFSLFDGTMVDRWSFPIANHDFHSNARPVSYNNEQPTWAGWVFTPIRWARDTERISIFEFRHKVYKA